LGFRSYALSLIFTGSKGGEDGPTVFAHACKMGLEGIVSKRKGSA
jgi:ATP-dependent DNA ligase